MLMPEMLSKLAAQVSGTDAASTLQTDMLHSWWLAESHLERLSADHDNKVKDADKQRQIALEYVQRFEDKLLPAKDVHLPHNTRVQRLQELNGYRSGSLQHYEKLKAWLHEEQHRLEFINAHLAFTLASVEGQQLKAPEASKMWPGAKPNEQDALSSLLWDFHKDLLSCKGNAKASPHGKPAHLDSDNTDSEELIKASPGASTARQSDSSAESDSNNQAAATAGAAQEVLFFRQQLQDAQLRIAELQAALEDAAKASASSAEERQKWAAHLEAVQEQSAKDAKLAEEQKQQLNGQIEHLQEKWMDSEKLGARKERLAIEQARELQTALRTNVTFVEINDTLQGQVTKLTADNNSFQGHVKNLQETTSSLSAQIAVLAIQAKAAAVNATQLQKMRSVAATMQQERDAARSTASSLTVELRAAMSQLRALTGDKAGQGGIDQLGRPAVDLEAQMVDLRAQLQQAEAQNAKHKQDNKTLRKESKSLRRDVQRMRDSLVESQNNLDAVPLHLAAQPTLPAPQVAPASPRSDPSTPTET